MTILSELVNSRFPSAAVGGETNLENGTIYSFYPGTTCGNGFRDNMCWIAPGTGRAIVEIWGASGSGSRSCCCGGGVPGNPGAYVKKTVEVTSGDFVTGCVGISCSNDGNACFTGCSQSTCITVCHVDGCTCLCAEGGYGAWSICSEGGNGIACCLINQVGLPNSEMCNGCGIVCNFGCRGRAYGGDVNCCGGQSCTRFWSCCPCCRCKHTQMVAISPGVYAKNTSWIAAPMELDSGYAQGGMGSELWSQSAALGALSKSGFMGFNGYWVSCWSGSRACPCYSSHEVRQNILPYGVPGTTSFPCDSVRHNGWRGGMGNVRITFIGS